MGRAAAPCPDLPDVLLPLRGSTPAAQASTVVELVGEDGTVRHVVPADAVAPEARSPLITSVR